MTTVRITGLDGLLPALKAMGEVFAHDVQIAAMRKAATPCVELMKSYCPVLPDEKEKAKGKKVKHMRDTIGVRERTSGDKRRVIVRIGPKSPHDHLVEFGHAMVVGARPSTKAGRARGLGPEQRVVKGPVAQNGMVPPHPFVRPAWDATGQQVVEGFLGAMHDAVGAKIKELNGKLASGRVGSATAGKLLAAAGEDSGE